MCDQAHGVERYLFEPRTSNCSVLGSPPTNVCHLFEFHTVVDTRQSLYVWCGGCSFPRPSSTSKIASMPGTQSYRSRSLYTVYSMTINSVDKVDAISMIPVQEKGRRRMGK